MKVLVCDPIHEDGLAIMRNSSLEVDVRLDLTAQQLLELIPNYDVLIVRSRTKVTAEVLKAGRKLRIIARPGSGLDNIDVSTAEQLGITVISTPEAAAYSTAELTVGLILSILRKIPVADVAMKRGLWLKPKLIGNELRGKTVGVIGAAGRVGSELCRILSQGFGCVVIGYDIIDFSEKASKLGIHVASSLGDLLERADIISLHVPYLPSTHHLIGAEEIRKMKKGAILINTSRGDVINGRELLAALKSGHLAGAGLDVFHNEPPLEEWEKELTGLGDGRVVCTCHMGSQTEECQRLESIQVAEKIIKLVS